MGSYFHNIIQRTHTENNNGLGKFPDYDIERHFTRALDHIRDKYGKGGYIKLWLDTERNRRGMAELQNMLEMPDRIRADFEKIFADCAAHTPSG